ncbi:MAG: hypothetical protein QOI06_3149 [Nocardioidaceae bacterium]|jgi:lipoprotein-anchoring transpeptidase ErfK/SrfK|nr:hypothetical protein [Nocardioidaceae bacterium]
MSVWAKHSPRLMLVASSVALVTALAGCSGSTGMTAKAPAGHAAGGQGDQRGTPPTTSPASPLAQPATLTATVKPAAGDVPVDTPVTVRASGGTLKSVVFEAAGGTALAGTFNSSRTTWTASEFLDPGVHYTLRSQAVNAAGKVTRSTRSFTSQHLTLDQQTYPNVSPLQGQVVGIGMPVVVTFDVPVTDRAEVQKYMSVTSTPAQVGSWHWVSSTEVHWRPKTYWKPGTKVDVKLNLNGVNAGNGIYGQLSRDIHFTIGKSLLIRASVATDKLRVVEAGRVVRTIPITGGKPGGFQTRSGIKLVSQKYPSIDMNSATVGIDPNGPEGYNIANVQYAMRVTNSGEFLHAAPWSVYAQGHYNVSHGCIGMSTANAQWLYNLTPVGTPVVVTGSSRPIEPNNGWTDWDESWAQYTATSAIR